MTPGHPRGEDDLHRQAQRARDAVDLAPDLEDVAERTDQHALLKRLLRKLDALAWSMEKANFADYVALFQNPRRLIGLNFVAGMARGLGMAVGFLLLSALAVVVLRDVVALNLPWIGKFLADLIRIIEAELRTTHTP